MFAAPLAIAIAVKAAPIIIAGAAISAIGGLTGSKELSMIGSFMGMANGVFDGSGLAGMAEDAAGNLVSASSMGEAAAGVASGVEAVADAADNLYSPAQTALAGGDAASEALAQAGSVGQGAGEVAGIQAPAATPPAQAAVGAPSSSPSGILSKEIARSGTTNFVGDLPVDPSAQSPGLIDRVLNWGKENPQLAAAGLTMGGNFLAKGLGRDVAGEKVDLERRALEARLAELDRTSAARRHIPSSIGMTPNPNANLYPNGYRPPLRGLIRSQLK